MQRLRYTQTLALLMLALGSTSGWPATDGALGSNSTGRVTISLQVPGQVNLTNLTDIELGRASPAPSDASLSGSSVACVFARGGASYQVVARGSGPAAAFRLAHSNGRAFLNYRLVYDDGAGRHPLVPGLVRTGLTGADPESHDCRTTGNNARVTAELPAAAGRALQQGLYTGHLTLVIAPD